MNNSSGRPSWLLPIAILLTLVLLAVLALAFRGGAPPAATSPTPSATATATATAPQVAATTTAPATTTAAVTPTAAASGPCSNPYIAGDEAIVPPRDAGQHLDVALDDVFTGTDRNRWAVRFFVQAGAPGNAVVPLDASVTGPGGPLTIFRYEYGPPNAGTAPATEPVTVEPCDASAPPGTNRGPVIVLIETSRITSGTYTLTWKGIRLPEGGTRDETWTVTLVCEGTTPGASCRKA